MNDSSGELPIDDDSDTDMLPEGDTYEDVSEEELIDDRDSSSSDLGDMYDDEDDTLIFADPGGRSALRAESPTNPRNLPCPDCGRENVLTPLDRQAGYCCNACADKNEGGGY